MSGVLTTATTQVAASSSPVTASEPSAHERRNPHGWALQRRNAARVSSQPWTRASSSAFMYQCIGSRGRIPQRAPAARSEAQRGHAPGPLEGDAGRHLRIPVPPLAEPYRHLDDLQPERKRAPRQLDLERVALRAGAGRVDRLQRGRAEALEAAGEIADADAEHVARVPAAPARQRVPLQPPFLDPAAVDVARAEHEVGA